MFLTCDPRKMAYTFGEQTNVVIWWQTTAPRVDFGGLTGDEYPSFEVFNDALVELMEDIRSDGPESVKPRKVEPEWMRNRLCADLRGSLKEASWILTKRGQNFEEFALVARSRYIVGIKVTQMVSQCATPGAVASECTGSQNLLGVVANETRKERMNVVDIPSSCGHRYSLLPCSNEGLENVSEACVIEVGYESFALGLVLLLLELGGGEVADKEVCTHGCLPTDFLRNIADCHVNWISRFISERSKLGFVCQNEDRDYCGAWRVSLNCHL